jgi:hypothetical protein
MAQAGDIGDQEGVIELALHLARAPDGRLDGTLHRPGETESIPFSGTLDLLRALEVALDESDDSGQNQR